MKRFLLVVLAWCFMNLAFTPAIGQTFTSNGTCNPMDVNNSSCWDITESCDIANHTLPSFSNLAKGANTCEVNIVLTQPVTFNGDLAFGGSFNTLTITGNGRLTVIGDLIIDKEQEVTIFLENGGELKIHGTLVISAGKSASRTILNIEGDGTSSIIADEIDLNGFAELNVLSGGGLISNSETRYNGNSSEINVYGLFITQAITIQGGRNHQLNVYEGGQMGVVGNVTLAGDAHISFGGTSEVEIGGELSVKGNAVLEVTETSSVKVCKGTLPVIKGESFEEGGASGVYVEEPSTYVQSCDFNILPVDYVFVEAELDIQERSAKIVWATSKEWENSHFEIERSDKGIDDFQAIGQVVGMGWSDMIIDYSFKDESLPLRSGPVYYRLKQVDFNGLHTYSKTMMVRIPEMQATKGSWRAYPNPVAGDVLKISALDANELFSDIQIKIISSQNLISQFTASDEYELNDRMRAIFDNIPQGLFVVELQWNNKVEYLKVIKR